MFRLNVGDLLFILSMAMWSIYTIGCAFVRADAPLSFLFVIACIGDVAILPFYLPRDCARLSDALVRGAVGALAGHRVLLVGARVHLLEPGRRTGRRECRRPLRSPDARVRRVLAWLVLDERLFAFHVAGIALILFGIFLTTRFSAVAVPAGTE